MGLGTRSFISFDKADGLGIRAQVNVSTGVLPVKSVTPNSGIARVEFDHNAAENLSFAVTANVLESSPFYETLVKAAGTGEPVAFRLETQRKANIDRRMAFPPKEDRDRVEGVSYLSTTGTKDNMVVKKLVMVNDIGNEEIATDPKEDERWITVPKAQIPPFLDVANSPSASTSNSVNLDASSAIEDMAKRGGYSPALVGPVAALAIAGGMPPERVETLVEKATRAAAPTTGVTRGGIKESQPWYGANYDGARNLGSYETGAALSVTGWAEKYLARVFTDYVETHPDVNIDPSPLAPGRMDQVVSLAATVLMLADLVQVTVYGTNSHADRFATSHSKARGVVFHVIDDVMPMTFAEAVFGNERQEWFDQVLALSIERFRAALTVLDETQELVANSNIVIAHPEPHHVEPVTADVPAPVVDEPTPVAEIIEETIEEPAATESAPMSMDAVISEFDASPTLPYLADDLGPFDKDEMGGIAPSTEDLNAFAKMLEVAGIEIADGGRWAQEIFHVNSVKDIHGPRLTALLNHYRAMGAGFKNQLPIDMGHKSAA